MKKELVYLAGPYSHTNPHIKEQRFQALNKIAAKLMGQGLLIYSPISHTHPIALAGELPGHWEFWEKYDRAILNCCTSIIVAMLPGWRDSKGVTAEIKIAEELNLTIAFCDRDGSILDYQMQYQDTY